MVIKTEAPTFFLFKEGWKEGKEFILVHNIN